MKTSIATVCISGNIQDKLEAIAAAGFRAVEIFENDLIAYPGSPPRRGWPDRRQGPQNDRSRDITGRMIRKLRDGSAHPAYLDQGYRSSALRGPTKPMIPNGHPANYTGLTDATVTSDLTDRAVGVAVHVPVLLDQISTPIASFMGDGAFDTGAVHAAVISRNLDARVIVPPGKDAVLSLSAATASIQRDNYRIKIRAHGRAKWRETSRSTRRSKVEVQISR